MSPADVVDEHATWIEQARGSGERVRLAPPEEFPGALSGVYLNSAAIGLVARTCESEVARVMTAVSRHGTRAYFEQYEDIIEQPRRLAARLLDSPPRNVAVATSISEVISQVAWWRRPGEHENVVMVDADCASVTYPWLRVARTTGAEMRFLRTDPGSLALSHERLASLVDDRTAAICVSHVQWISGYRFDLLRLGELARKHGALLIVDAMHSVGVVPLAGLEVAQADVLVAGSFKWLCGLAGAAPAYIGPSLLAKFEPILVGSRSSDPTPPFDEIDATRLTFPADARRLEYGSSILVPRVALAAAARYLLNIGLDAIYDHTQALGAQLAAGLLGLGAQLLTPADPERRAGIVTARFTRAESASLYRALAERNVEISMRAGALRFSPHFFNDSDEISRVLTEIKRLLP